MGKQADRIAALEARLETLERLVRALDVGAGRRAELPPQHTEDQFPFTVTLSSGGVGYAPSPPILRTDGTTAPDTYGWNVDPVVLEQALTAERRRRERQGW